MLTLRKDPLCAAAVLVVLLAAGGAPFGSTPSEAATEEAHSEQAPGNTPGTPHPEQTVAGEKTTESDTGLCKEVIAKLGRGDVGALDQLSDARKKGLLANQGTRDAITCFAVASGKRDGCDVLPDEAKKDCRERWDFAQKLKETPKKALKAVLFYRICQSGVPKPPEGTCEQVRDAMISGDATVCDRLFTKPEERGLCAGLVTGDEKKCDMFENPGQRTGCVAFVTGDPERCPKADKDCRRPLESLAIMQKQGLAGIGEIDPISAAAAKGKEACAPLVADLAKQCEVAASGKPSGPTPTSK